MRVLVVEDHAETSRMIASVLVTAGHEVRCAFDISGSRRALQQGDVDCLVLDWMLPDGSGLDYCRELRAAGSRVPVLILSARGDVDDRVVGLDAGGDDYLRKPFAVAELLARVRALERRGPRPRSPTILLGSVEIRLAERRILVDGRDTPVTARELAILEVLTLRLGHAVARDEILEIAWGEIAEGSAASLEVLIARLRKKLQSTSGPFPLRTHRGFGYSLGEIA